MSFVKRNAGTVCAAGSVALAVAFGCAGVRRGRC